MMLRMLAASAAIAFTPMLAMATPEVGQPAPDFNTVDITGAPQSLSQYKGKLVVLEWSNPECPFVKKFYDNGDMQKFQAAEVADGVVWLTVNSGGEGKQGNMSAEEAQQSFADHKLASSAYILDPKGEIGKLYEAKTTPHMYVIDKEGTLAYAGAIDDKASTNPDDIATSNNYVTAALDSLQAGEPVKVATTKSYGCSVKYTN